MTMELIPLLWFCGAPGSGKSTVGWRVFDELSSRGIRAAYVDCDQVGMCYPPPSDNPSNDRVKARGLGAVWSGYRTAAPECFIVSGSVTDAETVSMYANQVPETSLTLCQLAANPERLRERLVGRGAGADLIEAAYQETQELEENRITETRVDTNGRSIDDVVGLVFERLGDWPGTRRHEHVRHEAPSPSAARDSSDARMVWVCGATGVGKSTIAFQVFRRLLAGGNRASYIDLAQIGWCRPLSENDPDNHRLKAHNLGALWDSHQVDGARYLVVSGSSGGNESANQYLQSVSGCEATVCRLHADQEHLKARIQLRGQGGGPGIPGDELRDRSTQELDRIAEQATLEAEALEREQVGDLCVETNDRTPEEIVREILKEIDFF